MKRILLALIMITPIAFGDFFQLGNDIDGEAADDYSGSSVALSSDGSVVAIGAVNNDGNGTDSGHVRLYQWDGVFWNQLGNDIDGEAADDGSGGISVALSSDGSIVAIGALYNDGHTSDSGHVSIYQWNGSSWNQLGNDIDGESTTDVSGSSVALSSDGSVVAIGARWNDGNAYGSNSGHVRLYQWDGSSWNQLGNDIDGEAQYDESGSSVALSSDGFVVAIGAPRNDGNAYGSNSGHVRLYQWDGSSWNQLGNDIDGESSSDVSGSSVALSSDGSVVAIGARWNDGNGYDSGHVRLYQWDGSSWNQLGNDIDGESSSDVSGSSVALSSDGSIVAIGAPVNDDETGHVRLYQWDGSSWNQLGSDIVGEAGGDQSGSSVALSSDGSIVAIGAKYNDGNGASSGHVRVLLKVNDNDSDSDGLSDAYELAITITNPYDPDSDNDGLLDGYEINFSLTDANKMDSDQDGLSDAYEVNITSTNPNKADSDSDGLNDGEELFLHTTNPNQEDTDNDGLTDFYEINVFMTIATNADSSYFTQVVTNNITNSVGLTLSEVADMRVGSQMVNVSNNNAKLRFELDMSEDLTTSWQTNVHAIEVDMPVTNDVQFFRLRMD